MRPVGENRTSALLAAAGLVMLTVALFSPVIRYTELGAPRDFTLVGGLVELLSHGEWLIGGILLVFSVVFPYAKLVAILAASAGLPAHSVAARRRLVAVADRTGKYSMLDVFVVALTVVLIKFSGLVEAAPRFGILVFAAAIVLSMAAGRFVDVEDGSDTKADGTHRARFGVSQGRMAAVVILIAAAVAAFVGAWLSISREPVGAIRVEPRPGLQIPELSVSSLVGGQPDLMVVVRVREREVASEAHRDAMMGNGLDFVLPEPIARGAISEIALFNPRDRGMSRVAGWFGGPKPLDRVDHVRPVTDGGRFRFILVPAPGAQRTRTGQLVLGGVLLVAALGVIVVPRRQEVASQEGTPDL